ncbi:hypothetical protein [Absidia glauca]|uniref:Uncharacterized protein n=1 Tax=Absidia glauca TaxID=4829 RepID=A0A163J1K9_ABSGL|nr:hypothetical protein [Absidia glauca]
MSLSIELEHGSICLPQAKSIIGHLVLILDSPSSLDESILCHSSASIRLTGKEATQDDSTENTALDETYRLSEYHQVHHQTFMIPFDLPLPPDVSFLVLECSLTAMWRGLKSTLQLRSMQSSAPPTLSSSSSFSSSSRSLSSFKIDRPRLFWGMSEQAQWQYELELPQQIDPTFAFVLTLRTRMRCFPHKNPSALESCLIGVQLYESLGSGSYRILMTASRIVGEPSLSWSCPCAFSFELDQAPSQSAPHYLQLTLTFCSWRGESDRLQLECTMPMTRMDEKIEPDWLNDTLLHYLQ